MSDDQVNSVDFSTITLDQVARAAIVARPVRLARGSFMPGCSCGRAVSSQFGLTVDGATSWLELPLCSTDCVNRYLNRN